MGDLIDLFSRIDTGSYVGAEVGEEDSEPFEEKMKQLTAKLGEQFAESKRLEQKIRASLLGLGYEI